ncbi:recombinase family protein [Pacificibacter sp. AS14]|uniref:recombinase family protein n=1 Tax=Pacificibacter sp. AS14 TaxID=3135785 RepID=UPI0031829622
METQNAVIYARVSSVAQLKKGDGLASQESRCREYARYKGYEVLDVFNDNKSGGDADRPAMIALLAYLKAQKETCVVIIDDINRFARDVVGHWQLRALLAEAGASWKARRLSLVKTVTAFWSRTCWLLSLNTSARKTASKPKILCEAVR